MEDMTGRTEAQREAIRDYWVATTPAEERAAYARMMVLGLHDGYAPPRGDFTP